MEQCQELAQKIAELTGFTPLQVVIHRDEVSENAKGKKPIIAHTQYFLHLITMACNLPSMELIAMRITKSNLNTYKIIKLTLNLKNKKALLQRIQEQERKLTQMALELKKEKEQRHEKSLKRTYTRI